MMTKEQVETKALVPTIDGGELLTATPDFSKLAESWLDFTRKHSRIKSAQSERSYKNAIKQALDWFKANGVDVLFATDDDIIRWRDEMKKSKSDSTVQLYFAALKMFFSWLKTAGFISENPTEGMTAGVTIDRDKHKRDYLTQDKARELIAAMPTDTLMNLRDRAVVALMITTGLRCCEVQKAKYGDFREVGDCDVLYIKGKGHSSSDNYVKVAPAVSKMIREYLQARFGAKTIQNKEYLFVSTSRNHAKLDKDDELSTQAIRAIVKRAMKNIGYNDNRHTAHSLRHTAATLAVRNGEKIQNVKQVLRHKNITTTMIYAHDIEREKNNTECNVADLIF